MNSLQDEREWMLFRMENGDWTLADGLKGGAASSEVVVVVPRSALSLANSRIKELREALDTIYHCLTTCCGDHPAHSIDDVEIARAVIRAVKQ